MTAPQHPPRVLLEPLRPAARWLVRRRFAVEVRHADRFPSRGGVVVAANHVGLADGPLLAIFAPRPVHVWTKAEMFHGRTGRFLRAAGQIALDRRHPDVGAVRTALQVLRAGHCVGVFPEGTRGAGELDHAFPGAAYLALVAGVPVVPITMIGTREPGGGTDSLPARGSSVALVVGHPVPGPPHGPAPWPRQRAEVAAASERLRERMRAEVRSALEETGRTLPGPLPTIEEQTA